MAPKKAKIVDEAGTSRGTKRPSSSVANVHGIIFKNKTQREKYASHEDRRIVATRYPDFTFTLDRLGLEENVRMLLNNLDWLKFLSPRATIVGLTREFLSSLRLDDNKLFFRLLNEDFEMSVNEFGEKMGFPNVGLVHDSRDPAVRPTGYAPQVFWNQITGRDHYEARTAKASSIHNPVFRYIARIMACTICGRGEMGGVRTSELFLLWAMINQLRVNTCHYILSNLIHVAEQKRGDIVIGGMVTFIAQQLGLGRRLAELEPLEGNTSIDLDMCDSMLLAKQANVAKTHYHLLVEKEKCFLLPDPARTNTRNRENWLYPDAGEYAPQEIPVQEGEEEEMAEQEAQEGNNFNMQEWCTQFRGEQQRQGAELQLIREDQLLQSQQMEHMSDMLQTMMRHFNINQGPPPDQQ